MLQSQGEFSNKFDNTQTQNQILKYNYSQIKRMSDSENYEDGLVADDDYHVPVEYKIVDLPVIQVPQMQTLKNYDCKIYRKLIDPQANPAEASYEWKRKCHGRIKFIKSDGVIVVAAFQYGNCLNRLKQCPEEHPTFYNLAPSEEYSYNWVYANSEGIIISIALAGQDFMNFKQQWDNAKAFNSEEQDKNWINTISTDLFK